MALDSESAPLEEEQQEQHELEFEDDCDAAAHHPFAPHNEFFDISTTVDPSYIISLIRKLVPADAKSSRNSNGVDAGDASSRTEGIANGEEAWEEYGCVLWDLAATRTHAELMVENFVLEVLLGNLMVSQSVRVTEIILGIIGNLACHEVPMKQIVSANGLIEIIVDQLFLDDTQCLCEACRLLMMGIQGREYITWTKVLQSENVLGRIQWVAENTLNPQLTEKSVGVLLAILESQQIVASALLLPLMKLGLPSLLINLLAFEMSNLTSERIPERYPVLEIILRATEALSVIDDYSQEICSKKEVFQLACDLVKLPDKVEVANSCVTAAVLIANILSDFADLASEISQDLPFLQGLLDIFPFASDDLEARSAIWSIIGRLLIRVQESEMSPLSLHKYVSVLVSKSDLIEEDLLDHQSDDSKEDLASPIHPGTKLNARTKSLRRIISILNKWTTSKEHVENDIMGEHLGSDVDVSRLLECCHKYTESTAGSCSMD